MGKNPIGKIPLNIYICRPTFFTPKEIKTSKMAKILIALTMMTVIGLSASAQKARKADKQPAAKTAAKTVKKHKRRHIEPPPQNFQVCVNNNGYYICNQPPGPANTTHPAIVIKEEKPYDPVADARYSHDEVVTPITEPLPVGPVSQSYPENIYTIVGIPHPYQYPHYVKLGPYGYKRP